MGARATCTDLAFIGGRRYRPGEVFELPDGMPLSANMTPVTEELRRPRGRVKGAEPATLSEITKADSDAQKPKGGEAEDLV